MGAVLGLLFGVGLVLVWSSFQAPPPARTRPPSRLRPLLATAGLGEVRAAECLDLMLALNAGLPGLST